MCLAFLGPFPFPNAPFRSQLHPFKTLKVQQGGRHRGWLKKCFAHTAAYAISTLKTAQDARKFLFWPFFGPSSTAWLILTSKLSTRCSPIFRLALFRPFADRMPHFYPQNEYKMLANFSFGRFGPLSGSKCTFPSPNAPISERKGAVVAHVLRRRGVGSRSASHTLPPTRFQP